MDCQHSLILFPDAVSEVMSHLKTPASRGGGGVAPWEWTFLALLDEPPPPFFWGFFLSLFVADQLGARATRTTTCSKTCGCPFGSVYCNETHSSNTAASG